MRWWFSATQATTAAAALVTASTNLLPQTLRRLLIGLLLAGPLWLVSCASLQRRDPLQVTVAGVEPLEGEGMELRLNVKLRVQNPNDAPVDYNGVSLVMNVQGMTFASGVSDATGSVPRFGESVIEVPITISAFRMFRQAMGVMRGGTTSKVVYEMTGKLASGTFTSTRFTTKGEFAMPTPVAASE